MSAIQADFKKFTLHFNKPMGTSRGVLNERDIFILALQRNGFIGLGECAPLKGLSIDDRPDFAEKLREVCERLNQGAASSDLNLTDWPALRFALEAALLDLQQGGKRLFFETDFTNGKQAIHTNGLIVMSDKEEMFVQVIKKVAQGFTCIKIKIGGLDFETECELLAEIREKFPPSEIELRLDANGAFEPETALDKLQKLSEFSIHSVEQPIRPGHWRIMADLCASSPIPIALDEELIGINDLSAKEKLLKTIKPHYIILKPTLVGGLKASTEWIDSANKWNIGFWMTSALEANIGLNIISQWTSTLNLKMHQGLGTGQLFTSNFCSPLQIVNGCLTYSPSKSWDDVASISDLKLTESE